MTISCRRRILRILQGTAVSFFLIAPFIKTSNGNGLIRFDAERLRLYLFNNIITFDNFFVTSLVILLFVFIFIFVTQIFGRIWCGWFCPQSFFSKLITDLSGKLKKNYRRAAAVFLALLSALILSLNWMWYFIPPADFIYGAVNHFGGTAYIIWSVIFIALFLDFAFVGFLWCRYLCPYAKMQTLMSDSDTLYVGLLKGDEDKCINCLACVRKCPVKIDPRKTPDNACVYCETCIVTCEKVLSKRGGSSVIGYNWGSVGRFTVKRANLLITMSIALLLSVMLVYNVFESRPLFVKYDSLYESGVGNYRAELKLKNGILKNTIVTFDIENGGTVEPRTVSLKAKEKKKITVTIRTGAEHSGDIKIKAVTSGGFTDTIILKKRNN